jgi:hypothetical protein
MTRNPLINALSAALYIAVVACFMYYAPAFLGEVESAVAPIAMLSLFVFSAAAMSYIFFYQPVVLIIEGDKKAGLTLFLHTLAAFAVCTVALVATGIYFS